MKLKCLSVDEIVGKNKISKGEKISEGYDWGKRLIKVPDVTLIKENPNSYLVEKPGVLRGKFFATKKYSVLVRPLEEDENSLYDLYVPERLYNEIYRVNPVDAKGAKVVDENYTEQVETHYPCGCVYYKEKNEGKHPSSWFEYCDQHKISNRIHGINI